MQWLKWIGRAGERGLRGLGRWLRSSGPRLRERWRAFGSDRRGMFTRGAAAIAWVALVASLYAGIGKWTAAPGGRPTDESPPITSGTSTEHETAAGAGFGETRHDGEPARLSATASARGPGSEAQTTVSSETADGQLPPDARPSASNGGREPVREAAVRATPPGELAVSDDPRPVDRTALLDQIALPVSGVIGETSGWRRHPVHGHWYYEPGIELVAEEPTVYAVLPGRVARVAPASSAAGRMVVIDHGDGLVTEYEPLQEVYVTAGQYVSARAPIGRAEAAVVFAAFQDGESLQLNAWSAGGQR